VSPVLTPYWKRGPWNYSELNRQMLYVINSPEPHECFQTDSGFSFMFVLSWAALASNGKRFLTADAFGVELPQSSQRQFAVVLLKRF